MAGSLIVIALEGDADTISYPDAVEHSIQAAWKAYALCDTQAKLSQIRHRQLLFNSIHRKAPKTKARTALRSLAKATPYGWVEESVGN